MEAATEVSRSSTTVRVVVACLLAGTVLYIVPSALHGNPPVDSARDTLEYVQQRPSWRLVHLINILAVLLWAGAFAVLAPIVAPAAKNLGAALRVLLPVAAGVFSVYFSIHAFGLPTAASQYFGGVVDQAAAIERTETVLILLGSTAFTAQALLGLSIAVVGLTFARSTWLPAWIGWSAVVIGAGWLYGALAVNFAVIVPFTALCWVWTVVLAVSLWRKSARAM